MSVLGPVCDSCNSQHVLNSSEYIHTVKMFTFDTIRPIPPSHVFLLSQFPLQDNSSDTTLQLSRIRKTQAGDDNDVTMFDLELFTEQAMSAARSDTFLPVNINSRVRRDGGYGHGCSSGLGIFNFLLFLVVLAGLLQTLMNNAMINIMINGQNVSLFQVRILFH